MTLAARVRDIEPFRYMRYAKETEYHDGWFLAGSGMDIPSPEQCGFEPGDYSLTSLCHNYGEPRVYEALRTRYGVHPRNTFLALGSTDAYVLICAALLEHGDHVLAELPGYEAFRRIPQLYGAQWTAWPRRESNAFLPEPAEFKKLLTPRTKLAFLTNLHNPTMVRSPLELIRELAAIARENDTYLVVSEVYLDHLAPGTHEPTSFGAGENVIAVKSLTKVYGLGTLRFGWAFAPAEIVEKVVDISDIVAPELPAIQQNLGTRALINLDRIRPLARARYTRGLPVLREWVAKQEGVTLLDLPGGISAAIKVEGLGDSWACAKFLREKHKVLVAPGDAFVMPGWLRIGIKAEPAYLKSGLEALGKGLHEWRSGKQL